MNKIVSILKPSETISFVNIV